jgi:hypothetical protein
MADVEIVEPRTVQQRSMLEILVLVRVQQYRRSVGWKPSNYLTGEVECDGGAFREKRIVGR